MVCFCRTHCCSLGDFTLLRFWWLCESDKGNYFNHQIYWKEDPRRMRRCICFWNSCYFCDCRRIKQISYLPPCWRFEKTWLELEHSPVSLWVSILVKINWFPLCFINRLKTWKQSHPKGLSKTRKAKFLDFWASQFIDSCQRLDQCLTLVLLTCTIFGMEFLNQCRYTQ